MESLVDERKELMRNCVVATRQRRPAMPRRQKKWGRFMLLCVQWSHRAIVPSTNPFMGVSRQSSKSSSQQKIRQLQQTQQTAIKFTTTMATKADPSQFQPDKSSSSTDAIKDWCMKPDISSSESMTVIPGVGPATAAAFSKVNIHPDSFLCARSHSANQFALPIFSFSLRHPSPLSLSFRALLPGWHRHDCTIVGEIFVLCGR